MKRNVGDGFMMEAARNKRGAKLLLGCGLSLFAAACAHQGAVMQQPNAETVSAELAPVELSSTSEFEQGATSDVRARADVSAQATVYMDVEATGFGVEHLSGSGYESIILKSAANAPEFEMLELSNPSRIVFDIKNASNRLNRIFEVESGDIVSRIRVGAHPDKSRVVLDINGQNEARHTVDTIGNDIIVTFAKANSAEMVSPDGDRVANTEPELYTEKTDSEQMAMFDEPFESPKGSDHEEEGDEHDHDHFTDTGAVNDQIASKEDGDDHEHDDEHDHLADTGAVNDQLASNEEGDDHEHDEDHHDHLTGSGKAQGQLASNDSATKTPIVKGYSIETNESGLNEVIAEVTEGGFYELQRTAQSEYVLRIERAIIDDAVIKPILAGPNSTDIKSVRASRDGNNVLLRIFTAPEAILRASAKSGKITVTPVDTDSMRAQAEVELVEEPANGNVNSEVEELLQDRPKYTGRLISLDLQDTDIDNALRIIAEVSNLNIIASDDVTGKVTLRLIDVPWDQALDVILKTNGLDRVQEGNVIRVAPVEKLRQEREALKLAQQAEEDLEPLEVRYIRVNYAKAADLKPLVQTVLTERGAVEHDERSNQLIIKDINKGIKHVAELVARLDQRTPQVLLETQIVEANRSLLRDLGMELGFSYQRSPELGNATGYEFPNSIDIGGSVSPTNNVGASFPAAISAAAGSAVTAIFDSADGSRSLEARISSLETEGRVRIVSRPSVATINNKQASIKSVEKIRVRTPDSGLSVATGQGAQASSAGQVATEIIEIGIILEVTPQASPDYFVLLDINAKSSTLGSTIVDNIPSEIERAATSTVLVSSGQTFALGGIYKITDRDGVSGIPFLKDVPFLGHLFRNLNTNNSDEELIFFITPRIVEGSFDDADPKIS